MADEDDLTARGSAVLTKEDEGGNSYLVVIDDDLAEGMGIETHLTLRVTPDECRLSVKYADGDVREIAFESDPDDFVRHTENPADLAVRVIENIIEVNTNPQPWKD
jgi:hypothetical protein